MRRLSGLTFSLSTAQHGVDVWMQSLPDSPARISALQAGAPGSTASAQGSSSASWISQTIAVRESCFWRTSQASLLPPPPLWTKPKASLKSALPPESWENWPTAGGTRNGSLFLRPMLAPATGEPDGSATHGAATWPTPDTGHERINRSLSPNAADRPTIALAAKMWQTPAATDSTRAGNYGRGEGSPTFAQQAKMWPTPASRDYRTPNLESLESRGGGSKGEQLPNFVEHHFSHQVLSTHDGRPLSPTARTLPRRLNPAFACWLMGWPIWWTNPGLTSCAKSEMELYRCRLQLHLLSFCGAPASIEEEP